MTDYEEVSKLAVEQLDLQKKQYESNMRAFGDERYREGMADAYQLAIESGWTVPDAARENVERILATAAKTEAESNFKQYRIYEYPNPRG